MNPFNKNSRILARYEKLLKRANQFEEKMKGLNDSEFIKKTNEWKEELKNGKSGKDILPEAFALVREASSRVLGLRHYDVQLMGGMALYEGNIAEMKTGEGKTLVATLAVYLRALENKGVHVITVNEYLAKRDYESLKPLYEFLGLSIGVNLNSMTSDEKRQAYQTDITYGTNNEFGFDYLRDNMVIYKEQKVQRGLHFVIIDEVDSVLIDEARTPLLISGEVTGGNDLYKRANLLVKGLKKDKHYTVDLKANMAILTPEGVKKTEEYFDIENLYDGSQAGVTHHVNQALKAWATMKKDVDYVVQNGAVHIVDKFTGRVMEGRRFSEGLHQAIEAKENVMIQKENMTMATITYQNYFRLYHQMAGMTGTAKTEDEEFKEIYKLNVVVIPTNVPVQRIDRTDLVFLNEEDKFKAIGEEVKGRHKEGQPVLVGTASIEVSERLSAYLRGQGVKHNVLNAKNHDREADIIAEAGHKGAVTIATNMAGRGTDIKLGEGVRELGGLFVLGTERHESRRIDNQLRGRSGRQGDPGESLFFVSLDDEIVKRFGGDNMKNMMARAVGDESQAIESKIMSKTVETAQKKVEANNFDSRKWVLRYDDVLREHREIVYRLRDRILEEETVEGLIKERFERAVAEKVQQLTEVEEEKIPLEELVKRVNVEVFGIDVLRHNDGITKPEDIIKAAVDAYEVRKSEYDQKLFNEFEKVVLLRTIDKQWVSHIDRMTELRQGINLRSYAQADPIREYQQEGFQKFEGMMSRIAREVASTVMTLSVIDNMEREDVVKINPYKKAMEKRRSLVNSSTKATKKKKNDRKKKKKK